MGHSRTFFAMGALLCSLFVLLGCSRNEDGLVMEEIAVDEIDVAAAPVSEIDEADAVASILASLRSAREDIARGDTIDAQFALDSPADLLEGLVTGGEEAAEQDGAMGEQTPLAQTYALVQQAREYLDKGDLEAADQALQEAEKSAQITPEGIPYDESGNK